jgi:hypothetical protein
MKYAGRSRDARQRKLIFLLVLLIHCPLIAVIGRSPTTQKSATRMLHEPSLILYLDDTRATSDARDANESAKVRTLLKRQNTGASTNLSKPIATNVPSSNPITDWYAQAHDIAEDLVAKDRNNDAKRAFEHKMGSAQEGAPSSLRRR